LRPLDVNLASRPFYNNTFLWIAYALAIAAIGAFTAYNAVTLTGHSRTVAALNEELAAGRATREQLQQEGAHLRKEIAKRDLKDLAQRIRAANEVLLERNFSWTRLLNSLEEAEPYKVRLLDLRPVVTPDGILIQTRGIARDLENFWELQQRLQDHKMFRRVYPAGYSHAPAGGEFLFSMSFNYFPDPSEAPPEGQEAAVTPDTIPSRKAGAAAEEPVQPDPSEGDASGKAADGGGEDGR
jgi:hypothetical protein